MPLSRHTHEVLQEALSWSTAVVATASLYFILSSRAGAGAQSGDGPTLTPERARALTASTPVLVVDGCAAGTAPAAATAAATTGAALR